MTDPILELIRQRVRENSQPGLRKDPHRLVLTVEGGSKRSIVSASELAILELAGLTRAFDAVYGASGGAFNAAYFVAGQIVPGLSVYLDHTGRDFINPWRALLGGSLLDMDYLIDEVITEKVPLDWRTIISSDIPLRVVATHAHENRPIALKLGREKADILNALRTTSHIPGINGPTPHHHGGNFHWDAAILDPFCINTAVAEGATHILVLMTLPRDRKTEPSLIDRYIFGPRLRAQSPLLERLYLQRIGNAIRDLDHLDKERRVPFIATIDPQGKLPSPITLNRKSLARGAWAGAVAAVDFLEIAEPKRSELLRRFANAARLGQPFEKRRTESADQHLRPAYPPIRPSP